MLPEYVPPRNPDAKKVSVQRDAKYPFMLLKILSGVKVEGYMVGRILTLKYANNDLKDRKKVPLIRSTYDRFRLLVAPQYC